VPTFSNLNGIQNLISIKIRPSGPEVKGARTIDHDADPGARVARQTAAKALKVLADEGLVRQWPGLGFFVA
jgi:hypothetical protein